MLRSWMMRSSDRVARLERGVVMGKREVVVSKSGCFVGVVNRRVEGCKIVVQ
jgi:hypothetical protein